MQSARDITTVCGYTIEEDAMEEGTLEEFYALTEAAVQEVLSFYSHNHVEDECYVVISDAESADNDGDDELLVALRELVIAMSNVNDKRLVRRRGRPEVSIDNEQLQFLVEQGFKMKDICEVFGCSKRTIERRMLKFNISLSKYTPITDIELDSLVQEVLALFPRCGEKLMVGRLWSHGIIIIQRERVRESLGEWILSV